MCKLAREEQSDMVTILLNLAYIPDWVIQHEDFHFRPGWSLTFKALMDEYKENWSKEHGKEWKFQDEETEKAYESFMITRTVGEGLVGSVKDKMAELMKSMNKSREVANE